MTGRRRVVWVEDWQMQCCGRELTVGDTVRWGLAAAADAELTVHQDVPAAGEAEWVEDHHDVMRTEPVDGRVARIRAVWTGPDTVVHRHGPVTGWEPGEGRFRGYLVDLDLTR